MQKIMQALFTSSLDCIYAYIAQATVVLVFRLKSINRNLRCSGCYSHVP